VVVVLGVGFAGCIILWIVLQVTEAWLGGMTAKEWNQNRW